jgi:hypothetical protein
VVIQADILNAIAGDKGHFQRIAFAQIPGFDADCGGAAAWFIVGIVKHFIQITVDLKSYALPQFININHYVPRTLAY